VTVFVYVVMAVLVTASMLVVDVAHARYALAMVDVKRGLSARHRAARWSIVCWAASAVCFYLTVRYTMTLLPFEAIGLYLGTIIGTRNVTSGVPGDEAER
jgi:hypothetical protein